MPRDRQQDVAQTSERIGKTGRRLTDFPAAARARHVAQAGEGRCLVAMLQAGDQAERQAFVAADVAGAERKASQRAGGSLAKRPHEMRQFGKC
jgi:hypothetical protein